MNEQPTVEYLHAGPAESAVLPALVGKIVTDTIETATARYSAELRFGPAFDCSPAGTFERVPDRFFISTNFQHSGKTPKGTEIPSEANRIFDASSSYIFVPNSIFASHARDIGASLDVEYFGPIFRGLMHKDGLAVRVQNSYNQASRIRTFATVSIDNLQVPVFQAVSKVHSGTETNLDNIKFCINFAFRITEDLSKYKADIERVFESKLTPTDREFITKLFDENLSRRLQTQLSNFFETEKEPTYKSLFKFLVDEAPKYRRQVSNYSPAFQDRLDSIILQIVETTELQAIIQASLKAHSNAADLQLAKETAQKLSLSAQPNIRQRSF